MTDQGVSSKAKYKITNWSEYNKSLKQRGSLTIWIEEGTLKQAPEHDKKKRGRRYAYNDDLIEMILQLRAVFSLTLRSTEGFVRSILSLMQIEDAPCPEYTTLCRRGKKLSVDIKRFGKRTDPIEIAIDSTGLKVFGEGEWKVRKHGPSKRRKWKKLHIAVDVKTGDIVAELLTGNDVHDGEVVSDLLDQIPDEVEACSGDGAYDTKGVRGTLYKRKIKQKIPPQVNAVPQAPQDPERPDKYNEALRERDEAIDEIDAYGGDDMARKLWKISSGYHKRSLSENAMYRRKTLFSPKLSSRNTDA